MLITSVTDYCSVQPANQRLGPFSLHSPPPPARNNKLEIKNKITRYRLHPNIFSQILAPTLLMEEQTGVLQGPLLHREVTFPILAGSDQGSGVTLVNKAGQWRNLAIARDAHLCLKSCRGYWGAITKQ